MFQLCLSILGNTEVGNREYLLENIYLVIYIVKISWIVKKKTIVEKEL